MLTGADDIRLGAVGVAVEGDPDPEAACPDGASPIEMAAVALDRTLARLPVERSEIQMLVFATTSFWADGDPAAGGRNVLLDNYLNFKLVRQLLFDRKLANAQPHGVTLADGSNFVQALAIARAFIVGEGLRNILVVAADRTPAGDTGQANGAVACLLSTAAIDGPVDGPVGGSVDGLVIERIERRTNIDVLADPAAWSAELAQLLAGFSGPVIDHAEIVTATDRSQVTAAIARAIERKAVVPPTRLHAHAGCALRALERGTAEGERGLLVATGHFTWGAALFQRPAS